MLLQQPSATISSPDVPNNLSVSSDHESSLHSSSEDHEGYKGTATLTADLSEKCLSITSPESVSSATLGGERDDVQVLSTARLLLAHFGAALTLFLATTDATIVSTSLPTIASHFQASQNQYTWVGVAYLLTQTACQPLWGRISDLVGRKNVLFTSMAIFVVGSILCGTAQNITWLIAARGIAGIGGGGIVGAVWVITAEIVEVRRRAKWSQALSVTWSCSAVAGPLLGGLFSGGDSGILSWRWAFYLNFPVCFVGFVVLAFSLHNVRFQRSSAASWSTFLKKFDFIGLLLFMTGTSSIVVGFSFATANGWGAPSTLALLILGLVILICGGFYEVNTTRDALFPATAFKDPTAIIILIITFLHNFAFNAGTFYLALFYQAVNGASPLEAGMRLLPYSLGSSLASMPVAWFIGFWQDRTHDTSGQKWVISIGLIVSTLGFGLMILLDKQSPTVTQIIFPLISGLGIGMLFHAPYQVFTRALKPQELATGTSAFFLVRFTGATTGLAVAGAIFYARFSSHLPTGWSSEHSGLSIDFSHLNSVQPLSLREDVLRVVSSSIQTIWAVCSPCLGVAFIISLFLRNIRADVSNEVCEQRPSLQVQDTKV